MKVIPKGSCLQEIEPYMVIRLYDMAMSKEDNDHDSDPTLLSHYLDELPGWKDCPVWKRIGTNNCTIDNNIYRVCPNLEKGAELEEFLQRLHRDSRTDIVNSSPSINTWRTLCIIATIRAVFITLGKQDAFEEKKKMNESTILWGSFLDSINESTGDLSSNSDDDDDESSLLIELWPLIQQYIPWTVCLRLYRKIQTQLHMLTLQHPLSRYAQETIFQLDEPDFGETCKILNKLQQQNGTVTTVPTRVPTSSLSSSTTFPPLQRLHASQLWLDQVANLPPRIVGVLLMDPCLSSQNGNLHSDAANEQKQLPLALPQYQSCLPNTCLELVVRPQNKNKNDSTSSKLDVVSCTWMALYDLPCGEVDHYKRDWTLSTRPKLAGCKCFLCRYEQFDVLRKGAGRKNGRHLAISIDDVSQAQLLAHAYFQRECFEEAYAVYQECYSLCVSIIDGCNCPLDKSDEYFDESRAASSSPLLLATKATAADLWHSMAAVLLSQRKFAQAQRHWKQGSKYKSYLKELSLQGEKQEAYRYFDPLPRSVVPTYFLNYENMQGSTGSISSTIPVYVAVDSIDNSTCDQLVAWAVSYARDNGGWTTSRHYAVPTTDLPVHQVPRLLEWFQDWMPNVLFPLLQRQFVGAAPATTTDRRRGNRFYVHDAFLVRYEATAPNNFLPLHYDESTHSCVVALNDDFEGGGTYMYHLERSITPPKGAMLSFRGNLCLHGGNPVTKGVRYILATFLYLDEELSCDAEIDEPPLAILNEDCVKRPKDNENGDLKDESSSVSRKRFKDNGESDRADDEKKGFSFSFF